MLFMHWPQLLIPTAVTFILGIAAGWLQARALTVSSLQFREAKTVAQVRQVMVSTGPGKCSIALLWITGIGIVVWALFSNPGNAFVLWVSAYASFAFARELVALPAIVRLERQAERI